MSARSKHFKEDEKIYLREVRISDANENHYRWMNDPEVNQYLETRYIPRSLENIKSYVEQTGGSSYDIFFAICLKENDHHIGNIKLAPTNWVHSFADISLLIGEKQSWGKGIGTEAIKSLAKFAFNVVNRNKLEAGCCSKNIGSIKAFTKAGFRKEGILRITG